MRMVSWSLAVSAALFVGGIVFIIAAARSTPEAAAPAAPVVEITPVASIKQIMNGITGPSANVIYNSVSTVVSSRGVEETFPQDDAAWENVANNAAALIESANLLLLPGRAVDTGDWVKMSRELARTAGDALKAAQAHDKEGILNAGAYINVTCDECHARYQRQ